jgi:hypothetical protein
MPNPKSTISTIIILFAFANVSAQDFPRTFILDPQVLMKVNKEIQSGSKEYSIALKALKKNAEKIADLAPPSVMEKTFTPPSGNKHDYMSMGKYWWPDPKKTNGLPYMRRDGEVNPESKGIIDDENLSKMIYGVKTLSAAYYFLGEEEFAAAAARLLRVWFLDTTTCMNPNMNFAQAIPGRNDGRGSGIIDSHGFYELIDAVGMLEGSAKWSLEDRKGLQTWFSQYLKWLKESKNGKDEAKAPNNHGCWYDVQVAMVMRFLGNDKDARPFLEGVKDRRIAAQIEPDGTQPKELARTRSFGYSLFNLKAFFMLARLGEKLGVDLWHYQTKDGRSIHKALDYLLPYISGEKKWEGQQIAEVKLNDAHPLLMEAARVYQDQKYSDAASGIPDAQKLSLKSILFQQQR